MTTHTEWEATVVDEGSRGPGRPHPPTGVVTLAFTDIQGSTALWERYGDAFASNLELHNLVLRDAIGEHRGYEVKTEGDAFMVAFEDAGEAVRFAATAQQRLHDADWPQELLDDLAAGVVPGLDADDDFRGLRVRIGIHTGRPRCQPDPLTGRMDYFGRMVNRCARVEGVARGGQVVLSAAAWEAAGLAEALPADLVAVDLGSHALRGLVGEERIHQVLPAALATRSFPAEQNPEQTMMADAIVETPRLRTNLPARVASFVGREDELADLAQRFAAGSRLITLLGPGGTGKTTLSCRFGALYGHEFSGGVWLAQLEEAHDVAGLCQAVAAAMELELGNAEPVSRLADSLEARGKTLLVLDNFEQVVAAAPQTLGTWLERCSELSVLVTSRLPLHLDGEQLVPLEPLAVASTGGLSPGELVQVPAVRLFCDRAQAVLPDFTLDAGNAADVAAVVRELDGLPLAIELAAARVRMLPPKKIRERLGQRFELLRGKRRDVSARQATLRGAIDWSWDLLQPWERAAFAQCSVFAGGFTLEAAEAVLDLDAWPRAPWPEDAIEALVDQSLVRALPPSPHGGDARYDMLRSLQAYADEKLKEEGAVRFADGASATGDGPLTNAWERHGAFFARLGEQDFLDSLDGADGLQRRQLLRDEQANLWVAAERAIAHGDAESAAAATCALLAVLRLDGPCTGGAELASGALDMQGVPTRQRIRLLVDRAVLALGTGEPETAASDLGEALSLCREHGERSWEGRVVLNLAAQAKAGARAQDALELYEQALGVHREVGDRREQGNCLGNLADLLRRQGEVERSRQLYEQALVIHREAGNRRAEGIHLGELALLDFNQGHRPAAQGGFEQALAIHREVGNRRSEGTVLNNLSLLHLQEGHNREARILFAEGLALSLELGSLRNIALLRGNLGDLALLEGKAEEARQQLGEAVRLAQRLGWRAAEGAFSASLGEEARRRGDLETAHELSDTALALLREAGEQLELGKALCRRGRLELDRGLRPAAQAAMAEAESIAAELAAGPDSELGQALADLRAQSSSSSP